MQPLPPIDIAFCERTCRVAAALGWRLDQEQRDGAFIHTFHALNGAAVRGDANQDKAAALTSACRKLAERLI